MAGNNDRDGLEQGEWAMVLHTVVLVVDLELELGRDWNDSQSTALIWNLWNRRVWCWTVETSG